MGYPELQILNSQMWFLFLLDVAQEQEDVLDQGYLQMPL